jgi:hypothetical protein
MCIICSANERDTSSSSDCKRTVNRHKKILHFVRLPFLLLALIKRVLRTNCECTKHSILVMRERGTLFLWNNNFRIFILSRRVLRWCLMMMMITILEKWVRRESKLDTWEIIACVWCKLNFYASKLFWLSFNVKFFLHHQKMSRLAMNFLQSKLSSHKSRIVWKTISFFYPLECQLHNSIYRSFFFKSLHCTVDLSNKKVAPREYTASG